MPTKKILFVIGSVARGGAESQLLMLAAELKRQQIFDPELFAIDGSGVLLADFKSANVKVHDGGFRSDQARWRRAIQLCVAAFKLWVLLVKQRPSVVHGFLPLTNFYAALFGRLAFVPVVVTSRRALNKHQDRVPFWRPIDIIASRLSNAVTANSRAVKQDTLSREGGREDKVTVIPNGIYHQQFGFNAEARATVRKELGLSASQTVLITVANLIPYKGHEQLILAMAKLVEKYPDLCLLAVGEDRGLLKELKALARRHQVSRSIQWLGLRQDIASLLAASDIYVSASHEEGFSNSVLEALAAGKAVVATDVGGNPEMLEHGEIGLLAQAKNSESLREQIARLVSGPDLREEMGARARQTVSRKYSSGNMMQQYAELYQTLLR